tara:strand:- start:3068 stop:3589 length:522 start_codon:yes stop_codon:yes gene_type:complete
MGFQKRKFHSYKKKQVQETKPDIKEKKAPKCDIYSAAPCFSGECGMCANCCKTHDSSKLQEYERRYKDMSKIMGKNMIEEYREVYNKRLNTWCKSKSYVDPFLYGYAKEKIKIGSETYTLCNVAHTSVCDDPYCRVLHLTTDEYTQKTRYSKYPIYTSDTRNINLCGVCMDRM